MVSSCCTTHGRIPILCEHIHIQRQSPKTPTECRYFVRAKCPIPVPGVHRNCTTCSVWMAIVYSVLLTLDECLIGCEPKSECVLLALISVEASFLFTIYKSTIAPYDLIITLDSVQSHITQTSTSLFYEFLRFCRSVDQLPESYLFKLFRKKFETFSSLVLFRFKVIFAVLIVHSFVLSISQNVFSLHSIRSYFFI